MVDKWKKISSRNKFRILLAGIVLFIPLMYQLSLRHTVKLYTEVGELERNAEVSRNAPQKIKKLKKNLVALNARLKYYMLDTLSEGISLMSEVSSFCHDQKLQLHNVRPQQTEKSDQYTIATSVFSVRGNYTGLLKLLFDLEQVNRHGRISSVSFQSYLDHKIRKNILEMTVYVQNINLNE